MNSTKEFIINKHITLKLEDNKTNIYVKNYQLKHLIIFFRYRSIMLRMGIRQRIKTTALVKIGKPRYMAILEKEEVIKKTYNYISSIPESPVRFEIPLEVIKRIEAGKTTKFFSFIQLQVYSRFLKH